MNGAFLGGRGIGIRFQSLFCKYEHYLPYSHSMQTDFTYVSTNRIIKSSLLMVCPMFVFVLSLGGEEIKDNLCKNRLELSNLVNYL